MVICYIKRYNKFFGMTDTDTIKIADENKVTSYDFVNICKDIDRVGYVTTARYSDIKQDLKNLASI